MDSDGQNISRNDTWVWKPFEWEWWICIQLVLAIVGILGNLLVMLVIFWPGRRRCATDILIGALAVADFLTSIFIIPHSKVKMYPDTNAARFYCKIVHTSTLMWISVCASIFTLTTISIERLVAVRFPIWFQRLFSPKRTSIAIVCIWIAAFGINTRSLYARYISDGKCVLSTPSMAFNRFIGVSLFLVEYVLPVIVMVVAHVWTIYILRQRRSSSLRKAQSLVLQMLLIVVITFIICWTPDQFGFLVFNLGIVPFTHLFSPLYRCFVILAFANSCVNPFIYAAGMPKFRRALMDLFMRKSIRGSRGIHSLFAGEGGGGTSEKSYTPTKATESFEV
ncbi:D(2) dopamine receptor A-like [Strongylocentrotus purpuratus]|uniref:G-protein coupled receptors family 1 profile domain-containing protein n=1 Tax=Strongylocentrotus purpuratus TaxID=7668 RepID=A0A7M7R9U8_STRPU|nr:D(2) dopamine receptor A-like [Strongylocentrotus purpuratus]|eukprot:XP_780985.1 PREDICTED: D(2) dopamine receptor A-like [Strongylocentrotus purpuratus]